MNTQYITVPVFDYTKTQPCIIHETRHWAVLYKPPGMPTAPLHAHEENTLVYWFLTKQPEEVSCVRGKKAIEAGLIHRLDTDTRGLVLFAKDQCSYDFFLEAQNNDTIIKTYYAFVTPSIEHKLHDIPQTLPPYITSQYRNYGPKAKKTAPVFPSSRHYTAQGKLYTTFIESCHSGTNFFAVRCRLTRGYRHQVRTHLAALGIPIAGDPLYGIDTTKSSIPLQLYATELNFPLPENSLHTISITLPAPKMKAVWI